MTRMHWPIGLLLVLAVRAALTPHGDEHCLAADKDCSDDDSTFMQTHAYREKMTAKVSASTSKISAIPRNRSDPFATDVQSVRAELVDILTNPEGFASAVTGRMASMREDAELAGQTSANGCDKYVCKLTPTAPQSITTVIQPGKLDFEGLQGIFWLENSWSHLSVISFAHWKTRYEADGSVTVVGSVYAANSSGWNEGLLGWGTASKELYEILSFMHIFGQLSCTMKNGKISECSVTPTVAGIIELPISSMVSTTLKRKAGSEVVYDGTTRWLSFLPDYFIMRQIVDGDGNPTSAWSRFLKDHKKDVLVPVVTDEERKMEEWLVEFVHSMETFFWDVLKVVDSAMADFLDFVKADFNDLVPQFDVWEYKTNDVRPLDAMCPFKTYDSYAIAAFNVAGGGFALARPENDPITAMEGIQKVISGADGAQKIMRSWLWKYAASKSGGNVNPATNSFLHDNGPIPWFMSWYDVSNLMLVFVSLPAFLLGSGGNRTTAFMNFAKVTCFEPTVLGDGPQKFKYDEVSRMTMDNMQQRGYYTATVPSGLYIFNYDAAIFLSTGTDQHTMLRQAYSSVNLAASFDVPMDSIRAVQVSADGVTEAEVGKLVLPTVLEMLWGQQPGEDVLADIEPYLTYGKLGIFGQPMCTYILCPTGLSKKITTARISARKWALTTPYAKTMVKNPSAQSYMKRFPAADQAPADLDYTTESWWDWMWSSSSWMWDWGYSSDSDKEEYTEEEQNFVQNVIDLSLFAGFVGTSDLTLKCIQYQQKDELLKALFEENPETFIVELMRADSAVTSFTSTLEFEEDMILEGFNLSMAVGTPVQNVIATANRDLTHWDHPDEIDPSRPHLGDTLSWNGKAQYVEAKDFLNAPRFCPGYCASIKAGAAICAKYMGSFEKLASENKIGGPVQCENFNKDCVGEWSDWSDCGVSCAGGQRSRNYVITRPAEGAGAPCASKDGAAQTEVCNEQLCPAKCLQTAEDGTCMELNWKELDKKCPESVVEIARAAVSAGAMNHFYGFPLPVSNDLINQFLGADAANRLLVNSSASTWDVETFNEFVYTQFFAVVMLGLRGSYTRQNATTESIPTKKETVPGYRVGPTMVPSYDIDDPVSSPLLPPGLAQLGIQCLGLELRDGIVWRDDLNVSMRNRWDLVMNKKKYYAKEIERMLGQPFKRMEDYTYEKFMWYSMDGLPLYPRRWNFAKLFLQGYEEIYSTPAVPGSWSYSPAIWHDAAEQFLAFQNLAQHRVVILDQPVEHGGETAIYAVQTAKYRHASVRSGFAKLGADMYFSKDGLPLAISDGENMYWKSGEGAVSDLEWQYWKFVWRSSMGVVVTVREHLLFTHMLMASVLSTASRQSLGPMHPLRRYLTRFTWGTVDVNNGAQGTLVGSGVITGRGMPFADFRGTVQALWESMDNIYEEMLPLRNPEIIPSNYTLLKESPYYTNGSVYYHVLRNFTGEFLSLYQDEWCTAGALKDSETLAFQQELRSVAAGMGSESLFDIPPDISDSWSFGGCQGLAQLHESLSGLLFGVSGYHSQVGTVAEFFLDPEFASFSWREGEAFAPPAQHLITTGLAAATAKVMPTMVENYSHLCTGIFKDTACASLFNKYQKKFIASAAEIAKVTDHNEKKYIQMDPSFIENSVSK